MSDAAETKHGVPDGQNANEDLEEAGEGARLFLLPVLPIILGIFVIGLNIFAATWLWQFIYRSNFSIFSGGNFPTTAFVSLISLSIFIGLFLIAYAIVLQRFERKESAQVPTYVKWFLVPVLVAMPAPAITVWAAQMVEPIAPKPCIQLYQEAVNISKDAPEFKMVWSDRDQLRCNINAVLPKK
ncbi:hypothetical protein NGTWS0302_29410 [Mycolicibacterium cyprinidarum]|uniref:DUF4328 domain-containing protein n=1 Tax=Mycolicibacterium cyprinidarum TaxID=2860311 RepID=A0ABQ4V375_9MYCO|nr:hypothetical protein NGTWS1702_31660 [Mycolicibacterium sp. NGTWSNA01]GJF11701.1 hypothetical protein NGTWS0302_29410 [Mycolicibacterium sp. NGTWS0302]